VRQETINIYKFEELPDDGKQACVDKCRYINTDHEWWDDDYRQEKAKEYGIELGDRMYFDLGRSFYISFPDMTITDGSLLLKAVGIDLRTKAARGMIDYGMSVNNHVRADGFWYVNTYYDPDEGLKGMTVTTLAVQSYLDRISSFITDMLQSFLIQLRDEYEYQTSDEAIEETLTCNEYEFTADGTMY